MTDSRLPATPSDLVPEGARIFDRKLLARRRDRAAETAGSDDFLFAEAAERLLDRLDDVTRKFPRALDLGSRGGLIERQLRGRGGIEHMIQGAASGVHPDRASAQPTTVRLDEEALPFGAASFDLILANLSLHWVNDLPGTLVQIRYALKPDGLFLGAVFGTGTLAELQECLMEAEIAETGGASPRVSPFADLRDAAGLLQRAGFALPVADVETLTVTYPDLKRLMADLRGMGETNVLLRRLKRPTRRGVFTRAEALYRQRYGTGDGRIPATFRLLFLTGWSPHESQQQPARRGSGQTSLIDVFGANGKKDA